MVGSELVKSFVAKHSSVVPKFSFLVEKGGENDGKSWLTAAKSSPSAMLYSEAGRTLSCMENKIRNTCILL